MDEVCRTGFVESIDENGLHVRIDQISACSTCHSKSVCFASEKKEKIIDIHSYEGSYKIGDRVELLGSTGMGFQAVFWAYIVPLLLTIVVLVLGITLLPSEREGLAAVLALLAPGLYYLVLYRFRSRLKRKFTFKIRRIGEELNF